MGIFFILFYFIFLVLPPREKLWGYTELTFIYKCHHVRNFEYIIEKKMSSGFYIIEDKSLEGENRFLLLSHSAAETIYIRKLIALAKRKQTRRMSTCQLWNGANNYWHVIGIMTAASQTSGTYCWTKRNDTVLRVHGAVD